MKTTKTLFSFYHNRNQQYKCILNILKKTKKINKNNYKKQNQIFNKNLPTYYSFLMKEQFTLTFWYILDLHNKTTTKITFGIFDEKIKRCPVVFKIMR